MLVYSKQEDDGRILVQVAPMHYENYEKATLEAWRKDSACDRASQSRLRLRERLEPPCPAVPERQPLPERTEITIPLVNPQRRRSPSPVARTPKVSAELQAALARRVSLLHFAAFLEFTVLPFATNLRRQRLVLFAGT